MRSSARRSGPTIRVAVRVRPPLDKGSQELAATCDSSGNVNIRNKTFTYPYAVVTGSDQVSAFDSLAQHLFAKTQSGYSCTLIAYGQTGSGKTYTMFGPTGCLTESSVDKAFPNVPHEWGIFPRFVMGILNSQSGTTLHTSAIEVYQNVAYDLNNGRQVLKVGTSGSRKFNIVPMNAKKDLSNNGRPTMAGTHPSGCFCRHCFKYQEEQKKKAREDRRNGIRRKPPVSSSRRGGQNQSDSGQGDFKTVGEKLVPLKSAKDVARLARTIEQSRAATGHLLNERSSRSHCLVRVSWLCNNKKVSLLFVDLAGSERIAKSGVSGQKQLEAAQINSSLTTLGRCISRLVRRDAHIPYRDSTLTMLLRSSLGGKSVTSVIVNISPEMQHEDESQCTMRFGQRMTGVTNRGVVNNTIDVDQERSIIEAKLARCQADLKQLEAKGERGSTGKSTNVAANKLILQNEAKLSNMEAKLQKLQNDLTEAKYNGNQGEIRKLEAMLETFSMRTMNHKDVVLRQRTIKGLHVESSRAYQRKENEIRELEGKLKMLGGSRTRRKK
eukprot:g2077.t1